jgi:hypothetical protein
VYPAPASSGAAAAANAPSMAGAPDFALSWLEGMGVAAGAFDFSTMDPRVMQAVMDDIMLGVPQAGFSGM